MTSSYDAWKLATPPEYSERDDYPDRIEDDEPPEQTSAPVAVDCANCAGRGQACGCNGTTHPTGARCPTWIWCGDCRGTGQRQ